VDFDSRLYRLNFFFISATWWRKSRSIMLVCQLFIDFKKAYDSVMREVLYSILNDFGLSKKLVGLIKCV
jgi:hypothetical protein